jgi:hypothetical protein
LSSFSRTIVAASILVAPQHVDLAEALLAQAAQRAAQLVVLAPDDVRAEVAIGPRGCGSTRRSPARRARSRPAARRVPGELDQRARASAGRWSRRPP